MEQDLDDIEEGKVNWVQIIDEFYQGFEMQLENSRKRNARD